MKNIPLLRKILLVSSILIIVFAVSHDCFAKSKKTSTKFYDFSDQLIDGSIKKPSTIWMESRTRAKFQKLLSLKKSFYRELLLTSKESLLK